MEKRHFLSGATATILMLTLKNLVGMWYLIIGTRCFFQMFSFACSAVKNHMKLLYLPLDDDAVLERIHLNCVAVNGRQLMFTNCSYLKM